MKSALKASLAFCVVLVVVVAIFVALQGNQPANVNPRQTSPPSLTPTLAITAGPVVTASSAPSIVITYSNWTGPLGYDILVNITISNNGYPSFNASKSLFFIVYGDLKYGYNGPWTQIYGDWKDQVVPNGGVYAGQIAFNAQKVHTEALTLEYEDAASAYNIIYNLK